MRGEQRYSTGDGMHWAVGSGEEVPSQYWTAGKLVWGDRMSQGTEMGTEGDRQHRRQDRDG